MQRDTDLDVPTIFSIVSGKNHLKQWWIFRTRLGSSHFIFIQFSGKFGRRIHRRYPSLGLFFVQSSLGHAVVRIIILKFFHGRSFVGYK